MLGDDVNTEMPQGDKLPPPHYYGDIVRAIFVFAGLVMLATLPFSTSFVLLPLPITIASIIALGLLAGFMSPWKLLIIVINTGVSLIGTILFEYQAVTFLNAGTPAFLFFASQVLAIGFFVALYYSTKTLRWILMEG